MKDTEKLLNKLQELGVFGLLANEKAYNFTVAQMHAKKVIKDGNNVKIVSGWKGERELKTCEELVPIKGWAGKRMPKTTVINGKTIKYTPKPHRECGKPLTHVVSWEIDRWYGKKHAEEAFCEKHAKTWAKYLKKPNKRHDGTLVTYEPIEIRKLS